QIDARSLHDALPICLSRHHLNRLISNAENLCAIRGNSPGRNHRLLPALPVVETGQEHLASVTGRGLTGNLRLATDAAPNRCRAGVCRLWRGVRSDGDSLAVAGGRYPPDALGHAGRSRRRARNGDHHVGTTQFLAVEVSLLVLALAQPAP